MQTNAACAGTGNTCVPLRISYRTPATCAPPNLSPPLHCISPRALAPLYPCTPPTP
ncbi:hypothetical protein B484DRAFT_447209 [Ochromonadaceae sp. CCMP2298]|nr:hypothetical protein B484DRAFT_447209 [Ochromonadaceae sp. CCMP2298]